MIKNFSRLIWNELSRSLVIWSLYNLFPIKRNRIMFVSWGGKSYSCNPRFIAEAILKDKDCNNYDLNFAFCNPNIIKDVPVRIHSHTLGSLSYYYKLATARFVVSNVIFAGDFFPIKRRGQKYIQAQHGGRGIKKIDFDDVEHLPEGFLKSLEEDTKRIDLMLSESTFRTKVIRSAFRYNGEILEKGLPRNSVFFFDEDKKDNIRANILSAVGIPHNGHCMIYAPTFRGNGRQDVYIFNISLVVDALEKRFGGNWYVLIAAHPNMKEYYREIYDFSNPKVRDVGGFDNVQELLLTADILMTDYSSVAFDFSLQKRPVFSLVKDADSYDRGLYFSPKELPFPYAETDEELCNNIRNFNSEKYQTDLNRFETEVMGLCETGHGAEAVVEWIKTHN